MPKTRVLPASYSTNRRWTRDDARTVVTAQAASGLSVAAFAAREGIDPQRLYFWRQRVEVGSLKAQPTFIEVRHGERERVEIVLRSGRVVRVAESIDADAPRRLIAALEQDPHC